MAGKSSMTWWISYKQTSKFSPVTTLQIRSSYDLKCLFLWLVVATFLNDKPQSSLVRLVNVSFLSMAEGACLTLDLCLLYYKYGEVGSIASGFNMIQGFWEMALPNNRRWIHAISIGYSCMKPWLKDIFCDSMPPWIHTDLEIIKIPMFSIIAGNKHRLFTIMRLCLNASSKIRMARLRGQHSINDVIASSVTWCQRLGKILRLGLFSSALNICCRQTEWDHWE